MSKTRNNNGWKKLRRNPSSTAGARNALALAYSIQPDIRLEVGDNGTISTLAAEKADFCHGIGKISYLCSVKQSQQAFSRTPFLTGRHFLCPGASDMRFSNPVPEQKCPAACCELDNGKCWTVFVFQHTTSNCL